MTQMLPVSTGLLALAVLLLRLRGHGRWSGWLVLSTLFTFTLLSGLHLGLGLITGEGLNNAVFYHMTTGLEGADISQYVPHIFAVVSAIAGLGFLLWRLRHLLLFPDRSGRATWNLAIGGLSLAALSVHPVITASAAQFLRFPAAAQTAEGFTDPPSALAPPAKPRNLVIIYLESFERTYMDPARFPDLTPRLSALETRAVSFTGLGQTVGADFTIGGMVASQCGVPLILSGGVNSGQMSQFLSGATCLGDIFSKAGYQLTYLGGASKQFAGKGAFYQTHGYGEVSGLEELQDELADPDYHAEWGLQDDTLFDLARTRFDRLAAQDRPFVLSMLTLDTHHPHGHAATNRACADLAYGDGSNPMLNAVLCNDLLAGQFIDEILSGPHASETVIAVMSDHLAMVNSATDLLKAGPRRNLLMILDGAADEGRTIDRTGTTLDTGPTLLSYMGFDVPAMGFGVDLLRAAQTLPERLGVPADDRAALDQHLMGFQQVYDRLWDFPDIAAGAYVNLEKREIQFGHDAYALPALIAVDEDLAVTSVTIGDPRANETLTEAALNLPEGTRYLWFDDCNALALGAPDRRKLDQAHCLAGAKRQGSFVLRPLEKSGYLAVEDLTALWAATETEATEPAALQAIGTARGDLPTPLGLRGLATGDRGVVLQLSDFGAGASFVRRQTVDALTSGEDRQLERGISLVGLRPDGGADVLDRLDQCGPAFDADGHLPWKDRITAPGAFAAHLVLVHDSAFCGDSFERTAAPLAGLDLPVLRALPARKAYAAVIGPDGTTVEVSNPAFSRIRLYLTPSGPIPGRPALTLSTASVLKAADPDGPAQPKDPAPVPASATAAVTAPAPEPPQPEAASCLTPGAASATTASTPLPLDQRISDPTLHDLVAFQDGWWDAEPFGRWTGSKTAALSLVLPEAAEPLRLSLELSTYRKAAYTVRLLLDGQSLSEFRVAGDQLAEVDLDSVPRGKSVRLVLELTGPDLTCPAREGSGGDTRQLGLMLKGLTLTASTPQPKVQETPALWPAAAPASPVEGCTLPGSTTAAIPPLVPMTPGETITIPSAVTSGMVAFGPGWWEGEAFGRWMAGGPAHLAVTLPEDPPALSLSLQVAAFERIAAEATLRYEGQDLGRGPLGSGRPLWADLSDVPRGKPVILTVTIEGATATCPAALDQSPDTRTLGLMLQAVALREMTSPRLSPAVAHAGGRLDQTALTNSLEALDANAARFELIEIDLSWTTDGELVCLHDWDEAFAYRFADQTAPVDLATFRDLLARSPDRPRNCDLETLAGWLAANPGPRIVTDIKTDPLKGNALIAKRYPELLPRFVPQAYQPQEIGALRDLGFKDVIWTLYRFGEDRTAILDAARSQTPSAIAMPVEMARSGLLAALADELDLPLYVHTVNDRIAAACLRSLGATGVYTDDLDASDLTYTPSATACHTFRR